MKGMFARNTAFKRDISKWDVSNVLDMSGMFRACIFFNSDISKWDVSSVTNMDFMFALAASFQQKLCGATWINSKATKELMFEGSFGSITSTVCISTSTTSDVHQLNTPSTTTRRPIFAPKSLTELKKALQICIKMSPKHFAMSPHKTKIHTCVKGPHGPIAEWDVSRVTDLNNAFSAAMYFTGDISKWDVARVIDMNHIFSNAIYFNGDVSRWDLSRVTNVKYAFHRCELFNADISNWDVSKVTDISGMFHTAQSFNGDISKWDVSRVTDTNHLFYHAKHFTGDIWFKQYDYQPFTK